MKLGSCFENSFDALFHIQVVMGSVADLMKNFKLVHGEAIGTGGDTFGIKYCHAWIEFEMNDGAKFCFDSETKLLVVRSTFYTIGSISYTSKYNRIEAFDMINKFGHYGPWEERLILSEINTNPTFQNAKKGIHYE